MTGNGKEYNQKAAKIRGTSKRPHDPEKIKTLYMRREEKEDIAVCDVVIFAVLLPHRNNAKRMPSNRGNFYRNLDLQDPATWTVKVARNSIEKGRRMKEHEGTKTEIGTLAWWRLKRPLQRVQK